MHDVAHTLGVAPWSLHRWRQAVRFHAVHVAPPPNTMPHLVVVLTTDSLRIEGLDVESAAQLVARLR